MRKPALKPSNGNREELLERRIAQLEDRLRLMPSRASVVSGMWDIRGKLLSSHTADATVTVPAGVYRMLAVAAGGGGAIASGGPTATGTAWFAASSSGAGTTYQVDYETTFSGGGHGAIVLAYFDVVPFEDLEIDIGAAGTTAYPGNDGGATVITLPSTDGAITCAGGGGAYPGTPGAAGAVSHTVIADRNPLILDMMANGGRGSNLLFKNGGSIIGGWSAASIHNNQFLITGTSYGAGGVTGDGTAGAVYLYY